MASIPIIYNLRNLWVRKVSTILTIAGITLAVGILLVVLMLVNGVRHALVESGSPDNAIILRKAATSETMSGISKDTSSIIHGSPEIATGATGKPLATTEIVAAVNLPRLGQAKSSSNVTVRGVTADSFALRPLVRITQGREPRFGTLEIVAGRNAAKGFEGCQEGGSIQMSGRTWSVVGVFDAGGTSFESELWGDVDLVAEAFGRQNFYSSSTVALRDVRLDYPAFKDRLETDSRFAVDVRHERDYYEETSASLRMLIMVLGSVLSVLFTFGAILGAMVTMFAFVGSRTKEIGTLRALGFPRRSILICFLVESVLLALIGGAIACLPALLFQNLTFSTTNFSTFTDLTWNLRASPGMVIGAMVFAAVMGLLGGLLPAVRAARLPIISALREE